MALLGVIFPIYFVPSKQNSKVYLKFLLAVKCNCNDLLLNILNVNLFRFCFLFPLTVSDKEQQLKGDIESTPLKDEGGFEEFQPRE